MVVGPVLGGDHKVAVKGKIGVFPLPLLREGGQGDRLYKRDEASL
jgi:hypothetical protein